MPEQRLIRESLKQGTAVCDRPLSAANVAVPPLAELLQEIQATPPDQWPHLLQMIRFFRTNFTMQPSLPSGVAVKSDSLRMGRDQKHQLVTEALQYWQGEPEDSLCCETWHFIHHAFAIEFEGADRSV